MSFIHLKHDSLDFKRNKKCKIFTFNISVGPLSILVGICIIFESSIDEEAAFPSVTGLKEYKVKLFMLF